MHAAKRRPTRGFSHISRGLKFLGIDTPGAFQESWTVPSFTLHRLPRSVDLRIAALTEPLAVACHDVRRAELRPGETAVVIGGGPIGLLVALVARETGAHVVVSEVNASRLALASELGLEVVDPSAVDVAEHVFALTSGAGADVVFEVSGSAAGALEMTQLACLRGRLVVVAIFPEPQPVRLFDFFWKELELRGARVYEPEDYERAIALLEDGRLDLDRLITAVVPLDGLPEALRRAVAALLGDEDPGGLPRVSDERRRHRAVPPRGQGRARHGLPPRDRPSSGRYALARAGADIAGVERIARADDDVAAEVTGLGRTLPAVSMRPGRPAGRPRARGDRSRTTSRSSTSSSSNAGTIERRPAVEHGDDLWDRVLEVNLTAQFVLARELGRRMVAQGSGKIVFVASMLSFQGGVTVPGYAASKGGIAQLTKALANEWAQHGVNVNAVAPGYIATDNTQALRQDETRSRQILERIPAGRWGTPEDVAGAFVFLASSASDYVHGIVLPVDGGWLAR